jgi:signal transduction histidine kinase
VFADETQIGQVFQNLIQNAIKYRSPSRNLSIKIQYSETEKEYVIAFTDNGIGIHPENINKLFIIFNRLGKDNNGSGLGLAISKKVIDRHNGRIWVESKLDVGSIFYFSLPKNTSC